MKKLFTITALCLLSLTSFCQDGTGPKWIFSLDFGLQAHDKRLFDYSEKESLLEIQPEFFGTYQVSVSAARKILDKGEFEFFGGIGLSTELATFTRPFDHNYKQDIGTFILRHTNRYYQNLMQFPITARYQVGNQFALSIDLLPQFNFLTIADNKITGVPTFSWWRFDFYSVEVNPGLIYKIRKFDLGLKYRVFQIKKIDRILFNNLISDPRTDQVFETENPFKIWLSIGHKF